MESLSQGQAARSVGPLTLPARPPVGWIEPADPSAGGSDERLWRPILDLLRARGRLASPTPWLFRVVEIVAASIALLLLSPVIAVVALLVTFDSPGPCLFWQLRVGKDGRLFRFVKFRTLYVDARLRWPELYAYRYSPDEIASLHFKLRNDPRVTRIGTWLRKSTLDELPNLWNVIVGDVALVGPRPEIPEMLPYYPTSDLDKFSVRPGITGLAQVRGRGDLSFRQTIALDVEYVRTRTVALDVEILLRTIACTILRRGAF